MPRLPGAFSGDPALLALWSGSDFPDAAGAQELAAAPVVAGLLGLRRPGARVEIGGGGAEHPANARRRGSVGGDGVVPGERAEARRRVGLNVAKREISTKYPELSLFTLRRDRPDRA